MPPGWRTLGSFSEIAAATAGFNAGRGTLGGHVYFLGEPDGLIKIGYSANLFGRIRAIKNTCPGPVELLAATPGSKAVEQQYHDRFAADRAHGEWFRRSPGLLLEIASLVD